MEDLKKLSNSKKYLKNEIMMGINKIKFYTDFQNEVDNIIFELKKFLHEAKAKKLLVAGYGRTAKKYCDN